jgi:AraC-like DNA-binding protein
MRRPKRYWHPHATGTLTRIAYARAKECGIDTKVLLKQANLTIDQIRNADLRLDASNQINFLNLVAAAVQDDLFGFHLARPIDLRKLGFLYYIAASSETLDDALLRLARYSSIVNQGITVRHIEGKLIRIELHYVGISRHLDRHQIEFFAAYLIRLCRQLTGTRLVPTRVRFTHRRNGNYPELTEFFGSEVEFGAKVDDVSFAPTMKTMPIASADLYLNKFLIKYCEEALSRRSVRPSSLRTTVENEIVPLLPHGLVSVKEIAPRLRMSQRTLARRLSSEGLTFSDVLQGLKVHLAKRYLADRTLSISKIAWLLGYQEVSSFTHAYKRWTDKTPQQSRSRLP